MSILRMQSGQVSFRGVVKYNKIKKPDTIMYRTYLIITGAPGAIRTLGTRFRKSPEEKKRPADGGTATYYRCRRPQGREKAGALVYRGFPRYLNSAGNIWL